MGWRGTLRTFSAMAREAERESRRRQRQLEKQQKLFEKMQELERAAYEVQVYENKIEILKTLHHDCSNPIDWEKLFNTLPPPKPQIKHSHEEKAIQEYRNYSPTILDKIFFRTKKKKNRLRIEIKRGKNQDVLDYKSCVEEYKKWAYTKKISYHVLKGNVNAYHVVIKETDPFKEIEMIGSSIIFDFVNSNCVIVDLMVNGEEVIPRDIKSLLKSGKVSTKQMPKGYFYELYQDYVCCCTLRVARELFAILPVKMVVVNAMGKLLNTQSGHIEEKTILSVAILQATINNVNLKMIDPSDSMKNFIHNMNFKKNQGFLPVEKIDPTSIKY